MDTSNQDQRQQSQARMQPPVQPTSPQAPVASMPSQSVPIKSAVKSVDPATITTPGGKEVASMGDNGHVSEAALRQLVDEETEEVPQVAPHPVEVERSMEVQNAGVVEGTDTQIKISQELQDAGVAAAKEETPINVDDATAADLPMGYTQAVQTRKKTKVRDALKWFAAIIVYQWRRLKPDLPK